MFQINKVLIYFILCSYIFLINQTYAKGVHRNHESWWIAEYGLIPTNEPIVERVNKIFHKIVNIADKHSDRFPRLILLNQTEEHCAFTLENGAVIITQKALDICYKNVDPQIGDVAIGFVIAHELAHLSQNHFEKGSSLKTFFEDFILRFFNQSANTHKKIIELEADRIAVLNLMQAGFSPPLILNDKNNIFQRWLSKASRQKHNTGHPSSLKRIQTVNKKIQQIVSQIELFEIGIRLYQLGRFHNAKLCFEEFRKSFPSREVFNNIGLCYYQLAMDEYRKCAPEALYRFKLSTILDLNTQASRYNLRSQSTKESCNQNKLNRLLVNANRNLKKACEKDPHYVLSHVNYSSSLIMQEDYNLASSQLKKFLDNPDAMNNYAICLYLFDKEPFIEADMYSSSCNLFEKLINQNNSFANAYYNYATINQERKNNSAAKVNYKKFLEIEKVGKYAEKACMALHQPYTPYNKISTFHQSPPVELGVIDLKKEKYLAGFEKKVWNLGSETCETYQKEDIFLIVWNDIIEIIEDTVEKKMNEANIKADYGEPVKVFTQSSGEKVLIYKGFAIILGNGICRVIFYDV